MVEFKMNRVTWKMTDAALTTLQSKLNLNSITGLKLSNCSHVSSNGWINFFSSFNQNTYETLNTLNLWCCDKLNNELIEIISRKFPNLIELDVAETKI